MMVTCETLRRVHSKDSIILKDNAIIHIHQIEAFSVPTHCNGAR